MKKIVAILLALCLMTLCAASAETVLSIADPVISVDLGETQTIDLTGLTLNIAVGEVDGALALRVDFLNNGSKLYGLDANVVDEKVVIAFDGVSQTYSASMPELPSVSDFDVSSLNIDTDALVETIMTQAEFDGDSIRVPYTAVNEVLEALVPALEGVEIPGVDLSEMSDMVSQLKASDSGVNLEIGYAQTEAGFSGSVVATLVENGEAGEVVLTAQAALEDNAADVTLDVPQVGTLYCTTHTSGDEIALVLGVTSSEMSGNFSGVVSMRSENVTFAQLDAANAIDVESLTSEQTESLGMELMGAASGLIGFVFGALDAAA